MAGECLPRLLSHVTLSLISLGLSRLCLCRTFESFPKMTNADAIYELSSVSRLAMTSWSLTASHRRLDSSIKSTIHIQATGTTNCIYTLTT
jgi:hypothetical protein